MISFLNSKSFYNVGMSSTDVGVFEVDILDNEAKFIIVNSILQKCFAIPYSILSKSADTSSNCDGETEEENHFIIFLM